MSNIKQNESQESRPVFIEILQRAAAKSSLAAAGLEQDATHPSGHSQTWHGMEEQLTPRELEVLKLIAGGDSCRQIAQNLGIAFRTARTHRSHIMEKLDMHETSALVRYAIRTGLISA